MDRTSRISRSPDSSGDSSSSAGSFAPLPGPNEDEASGEVTSLTPQDIRVELSRLKVWDYFLTKISLCWSGGMLFLRVASLVYHVPLYNVTSCDFCISLFSRKNMSAEALYLLVL
ncbi:hypothetical protein FH972_010934 [Carpinus fangiana]|uniref:Uncharacterized protein n=1 Tax=Carpinus fangiana TaxID=176857 RepID=A0A660KPR1_9ROSI|nr:hypothetical protein FH972_010934 [Carpinus fangiana]